MELTPAFDLRTFATPLEQKAER